MISISNMLLERAQELLEAHGFKFRSVDSPAGASISFYGPTRLLDLEAAEGVLADELGESALLTLNKVEYA